jgi:hypothetical protein
MMKSGDLVRSTWMIDSATGSGMVGIIVGTITSRKTPIVLWNGQDLGKVVSTDRPNPDRWEYLTVVDESCKSNHTVV